MNVLMKVMSFNLRGALSRDGRNVWPLRRGLVRELLDRHRPTIGAFQEVWAPVEPFLGRVLPTHDLVRGPPTGFRLLPVRNLIYAQRNMFAIRRPGGFVLGAPGLRGQRCATWVEVEHEEGHRFLVMNTHLDHRSERHRELGAARILEELARIGWPEVPAILCGDFNENSGGPVHRRLCAAGFRDAYLEAGGRDDDEAFTFHGFTGQRVGEERRIDWILCSGPLQAVRAEIVRDARPPRYPSDHFPLVADLEWRTTSATPTSSPQ